MTISRDPRVCAICGADTELTTTDVGPLCGDCADERAAELEARQ